MTIHFAFFVMLNSFQHLNILMNLITIFLTGLLTGGLTCMAVQGGLLTATLAQRQQDRLKNNLKTTGNTLPIISFLIAKLISYTLLGALLGFFGSFFQLSIIVRIALQLLVAIFMIGSALNLLQVHPIFRYFAIQPPRFLYKILRNQSKSKDLFAPVLLGAFTIFLPCGTTQAMMALAVASANPMYGAAILFSFVLGTSPIFFILGILATKLSEKLSSLFMKGAAAIIILLALLNIDTAIALTGSNTTIRTFLSDFYCAAFSTCNKTGLPSSNDAAVQEATITIDGRGYTPNTVTVKAGTSVKLHLKNVGGGGCAAAFTIPKFNIQKIVRQGNDEEVSFLAPNETGDIPFMCSMNMYRGVIKVIS
jgi:uncharacterized protein